MSGNICRGTKKVAGQSVRQLAEHIYFIKASLGLTLERGLANTTQRLRLH